MSELGNLDAEYRIIANTKYRKTEIGWVDNSAPEIEEYLSRGLKGFDKKVPQFIQTIITVSSASSRNDKLNLLEQCQEKYQKDVEVSQDNLYEMGLRQRERGN